ncbi:serine protease [Desulfovibrio mangrovi]|uniref:S1 family peptidase n=1 Tax=Desulfovibrio mangrovi TaxID=2976983 RepID=UPI00224709D3|nr:serine protease [Desulfovibrio mangrovi]UZP67912.1 serine protease [Desulfovibrio mangrovi]
MRGYSLPRMMGIIAALGMVLMLVACNGPVSMGSSPAIKQVGGQVVGPQEVYEMSFFEAVDMAQTVAKDKFREAEIDYEGRSIRVKNCMYPGGCMSGEIKPLLLRDYNTSKSGVIFLLDIKGENSSDPFEYKRHADLFYGGIKEYAKLRGVSVSTFRHYTQEEGTFIEVAPKEVPRDLAGFVYWLDKKEGPKPYEGVYEFSNGRYTLGLYYDGSDRVYKYKAMILETRTREWNAGEIKIKFNKLEPDSGCLSRYFRQDKTEIGATWKVFSDGLVAHNVVDSGSNVVLLPVDVSGYASEGSGRSGHGGSKKGGATARKGEKTYRSLATGTSWLISKKYLVTCNHVVDTGDTYFVRVGDDYKEVRVVARDHDLDLAALKLVEGTIDDPALPLRKSEVLENGSEVYALGYPEAGLLGVTTKITDGIISAQTGFKGRAQDYQISVPLQHGNSGGPVLDESGNVVGVASSILRPDIADNVSFMVKYQFLKMFLQSHNVEFTESDSNETMKAKEIFRKYGSSVYFLWVLERSN